MKEVHVANYMQHTCCPRCGSGDETYRAYDWFDWWKDRVSISLECEHCGCIFRLEYSYVKTVIEEDEE